jgi:hypothetical protein
LDIGDQGQLAIINVYGKTGVVTRRNPEKCREFYDQVQQTYVSKKRKSSLLFILGDFNSKIGVKAPTDTEFMGSYGKRYIRRNENGNNLKELAESEDLNLINTHFKQETRRLQPDMGTGRRRGGVYRVFLIKLIIS